MQVSTLPVMLSLCSIVYGKYWKPEYQLPWLFICLAVIVAGFTHTVQRQSPCASSFCPPYLESCDSKGLRTHLWCSLVCCLCFMAHFSAQLSLCLCLCIICLPYSPCHSLSCLNPLWFLGAREMATPHAQHVRTHVHFLALHYPQPSEALCSPPQKQKE